MRYLSFLSHLLYGIAGTAIVWFLGFCLLTLLFWFLLGPYDLSGIVSYVLLGVSFITFGIPGFVLGLSLSETLDDVTEQLFLGYNLYPIA